MGTLKTTFLALLLGSSAVTHVDDVSEHTSMQGLVGAYFNAVSTVFKAGSTIDELNSLMSLTTDDVQYWHQNFGAQFDRHTWHGMMLERVEQGRYNKPANFCYEVINAIPGKGALAVEYFSGFADGEGVCKAKDERLKLAVFKFAEDMKIKQIEELW